MKTVTKVSFSILSAVERAVLRVNGWTRNGFEDSWNAPPGHHKPHQRITQGHAINSMKQWYFSDVRVKVVTNRDNYYSPDRNHSRYHTSHNRS